MNHKLKSIKKYSDTQLIFASLRYIVGQLSEDSPERECLYEELGRRGIKDGEFGKHWLSDYKRIDERQM